MLCGRLCYLSLLWMNKPRGKISLAWHFWGFHPSLAGSIVLGLRWGRTAQHQEHGLEITYLIEAGKVTGRGQGSDVLSWVHTQSPSFIFQVLWSPKRELPDRHQSVNTVACGRHFIMKVQLCVFWKQFVHGGDFPVVSKAKCFVFCSTQIFNFCFR